MKVIHIVTYDKGGARNAALRLCKSLQKEGIDSEVYVFKKETNEKLVNGVLKNKLSEYLYKVLRMMNLLIVKKINKNAINNFSLDMVSVGLENYSLIRDADIIQLHWINSGMVSYKTLLGLKKSGKPLVWTLHDMCPFTGGCHYSGDCDKYKKKCSECTVLNSNKRNDLATKIQNKKARLYQDLNMIVVGCSRWITECAESSVTMGDLTCINIGNCIDTNIFRPLKVKTNKNIPINKTIILFGAFSATSDKRKGFIYIQQLVKIMDSKKFHFLVFGNAIDVFTNDIDNLTYLGNIENEKDMVEIYNIADVFVAPSKQENLAYTVMESLSCGTPVVAFNIGGMPDMIIHKINGYIAEPYSIEDFITGIDYCNKHKEMGENARNYVVSRFSPEIISNKYIEVYKQILRRQGEKK